MKPNMLLIAVSALMLVMSPDPASASVVDFRGLAASEASLLHHYTFEGDATQRVQDSAGTVHLQGVAYGTQGSTAALQYPAGIDTTTTGFTSQRLGDLATSAGGAYLQSTSNATTGTSVTVEALVRPEDLESGATVGYGVAHRGSPTRAYFITEVPSGGQWAVASITGDSFTAADNRRPVINPYTPGHWYYLANTYEEVGGKTVVNSYVADLSAGETQLTQVLNNAEASGTFSGSSRLGIGGFGASVLQAWAGSLDEVAIYGDTLSKATLGSHLQALIAPSATNTAAMRQAVAGRTRSDPPLHLRG